MSSSRCWSIWSPPPAPTGERLGFAKVNPASADDVKAAIAIFGYVWTGINVLACNMTEFADAQPWDYQPDSRHRMAVILSPAAGHATPGPRPLGGDERFITWGQELDSPMRSERTNGGGNRGP